MKFKWLIAALGLVAALVANAQEQNTADAAPPKVLADAAQIRKLIEASGLLMVAAQRFAEAMTAQEMQQLAFPSQEDELRAKAALYQESKLIFEDAARAPDGLLDRIVPVYQRYLNKREVEVLLEFYELNLDGKLNSAGGIISGELRRLAEAWSGPQQAEFQAKLRQVLQREGVGFERR